MPHSPDTHAITATQQQPQPAAAGGNPGNQMGYISAYQQYTAASGSTSKYLFYILRKLHVQVTRWLLGGLFLTY